MLQFKALGLSPLVLRSVETLGFDTPTPIQTAAIPLVLEGKDVMGLAQTGTGKTAAFGLPLVHHLLDTRGKPPAKTIRSLVLAPTRELVNQIAENLRAYTKGTPLRVECVVGGAPINRQIRNLGRGADILVATPGRLLDLTDRKAVFLDKTTFLVLDEADQMLDMGFIHSLKKIAQMLTAPRQTMLFSATMPKQIEDLARAYLKDPVRVETAPSGRAADKVRQSVHFVAKPEKAALLKDLLSERPGDLSLVFSRTKHGAEKLMKVLEKSGHPAASIHGNKSQAQRERALKAFRAGKVRILVATDVAARGIDIPGVSHVYNYDLPEVPENYVHRIGRTARAGREGEGVAFCSPEEIGLLRAVEKLMRMSVEVASGEPPANERMYGHGRSIGRNGKGNSGGGRSRGGSHGGRPQRDGRRDGQRDERRDERGRSKAKPRKEFFETGIADLDAFAAEQERVERKRAPVGAAKEGGEKRRPRTEGAKPSTRKVRGKKPFRGSGSGSAGSGGARAGKSGSGKFAQEGEAKFNGKPKRHQPKTASKSAGKPSGKSSGKPSGKQASKQGSKTFTKTGEQKTAKPGAKFTPKSGGKSGDGKPANANFKKRRRSNAKSRAA